MRDALELCSEVAERWRWVLEGTRAARVVVNGAGTPVTTVPVVTDVDLGRDGGPITLTVRLLAGQLPEDLTAEAARIWEGMACPMIRVRPWRPGYVRVALLRTDPLARELGLDLDGDTRGVLVGLLEDGEPLHVRPEDLPHLMVQGQTRSGKSTWLYAVVAQLVRDPLVRVAGVDPSGILLRPFTGTEHAAWQTCGLGDLQAAEDTLTRLVADMDARLAAMPHDRDVLPVSDTWPLTVTVLDEYPALLRAVDAADPKAGKRVRALVARLLAESHKVGHRIVIAAQRAEAQIVGAAERAQCAGRLTFRVDSGDTVKLLHPDGDEHAAAHTTAPAGIALCTWPGAPLRRLRGPRLGEYAEYVQAVRDAA